MRAELVTIEKIKVPEIECTKKEVKCQFFFVFSCCSLSLHKFNLDKLEFLAFVTQTS